jgi:hypothetical protein
MKSVVTATYPDGRSVAQLWNWGDISTVPWWTFFLPVAELVHEVEPDAVWTAVPLAEDETEKHALTGH